MSNNVTPKARKNGLLVQTVGAETVIHDTTTNKAYVLSPSAAAIWHACNGQHTIHDLRRVLGKDTSADEQVIWYALRELQDLLQEPLSIPPHLSGISRRSFLKMTGAVAAGVTIPVVVKMAMPAPAAAQSSTACCICQGGATNSDVTDCDACRIFCVVFGGIANCSCGT